MVIDTIDNVVAVTGFGEAFLKNKTPARASDNTADPIASTTATELIKIIPS